MSAVTSVFAESEHLAPMLLPTWAFGLIAIIGFAVLLGVLLSFRDVANRHPHKAAADASEHAGGPGATSHGEGHPLAEREHHHS